MSRTYRFREFRNKSWVGSRDFHHMIQWRELDPSNALSVRTAFAELHADGVSYSPVLRSMGCPPHWYRNILNKTFRRSNKVYSRKCLDVKDYYDANSAPRRVRDAGWYW